MCFMNVFSDVDKCCHCITDLKTASAIIAVLAMVTSPALAWAITRHSYVIRVSCYITTTSNKEDIIDINLNNVVRLGFGANADVSASCFIKKITNSSNSSNSSMQVNNTVNNNNSTVSSHYIGIVKWIGWTVLCCDLIFVVCSLVFLIHMFGPGNPKLNTVSKLFLCSGILATFLSFLYGMLHVITCMIVGENFLLIEFVFFCVDLAIWMYFFRIINCYRRKFALATDVSTKISISDEIGR